MFAIRDNREYILMDDFLRAVEKVRGKKEEGETPHILHVMYG
jgi:ATP-dependent 26S proteasome regulatory subunit